MNRRRRGEADEAPSYARPKPKPKASNGPKPFVSSVPPPAEDRTYGGYMSAALSRAGTLSYRPLSSHRRDQQQQQQIGEIGEGGSGEGALSTVVRGSVLRLPPVDPSQQRSLHGALLQKRHDATYGRTLEECMATAETRRRNLANGPNEGTINIPSYSAITAFANNAANAARTTAHHLSSLRTGKGLPAGAESSENERFRALLEGRLTREETAYLADREAFKVVNPDYVTLGGFRGSYGLEATAVLSGEREAGTPMRRRGPQQQQSGADASSDAVNQSALSGGAGDHSDLLLSGEGAGRRIAQAAAASKNSGGNPLLAILQNADASASGGRPRLGDTTTLQHSNGGDAGGDASEAIGAAAGRSASADARARRLYQVRRSVEALNDATNVPTHTLLKLQEEYNALERREGRGYLTVGQVAAVIKGFDSFGVPRSDAEIEALVRLGGVKRAHRHHLRQQALGSNIVPPDGITFNDYCAIMLQLNSL